MHEIDYQLLCLTVNFIVVPTYDMLRAFGSPGVVRWETEAITLAETTPPEHIPA